MSVVIVRYTREATKQSFILAQAAEQLTNTLHSAFEEYLVGGWTTEILAYLPWEEAENYRDYDHLSHREERAHGEYQWD